MILVRYLESTTGLILSSTGTWILQCAFGMFSMCIVIYFYVYAMLLQTSLENLENFTF